MAHETHCTCRLCRDCCKKLPGALTHPEDLAERVFVASAGSLLQNSKTGDIIEVPTLAFRAKLDGSCQFYRSNRCGIYDHRPSAPVEA